MQLNLEARPIPELGEHRAKLIVAMIAVPCRHHDPFTRWIAALEARHFAELTFPEVSRALRALSSTYVERRQKLAEGAALVGRRQARRVRAVLRTAPPSARASHRREPSRGDANHPDAHRSRVRHGRVRRGVGARVRAACRASSGSIAIRGRLPRRATPTARSGSPRPSAAATSRPRPRSTARPRFSRRSRSNELADPARDALLPRLLDRARQRRSRPRRRAARRLRRALVEEVAGRVRVGRRPRRRMAAARTELPPIVEKLDRAAGLNHREITGRSLWLAG